MAGVPLAPSASSRVVGRNVEHQPMGESAREVELGRQIGIRHADRKALRSRRRAGPREPRRNLVFLGKALRDDRPCRATSGALNTNGSSRFGSASSGALADAAVPATRFHRGSRGVGRDRSCRFLLVRLARQRCARTAPEHRVQNHMAVKGRGKFATRSRRCGITSTRVQRLRNSSISLERKTTALPLAAKSRRFR